MGPPTPGAPENLPLYWMKRPGPDVYYPNGFNLPLQPLVSSYVKGGAALPLEEAVAAFAYGDLFLPTWQYGPSSR